MAGTEPAADSTDRRRDPRGERGRPGAERGGARSSGCTRASSTTLDGGGCPHEIIFVDDGSRDGTFDTLARLHDADARVRVVSFKRNVGQHPAMHAGIAAPAATSS